MADEEIEERRRLYKITPFDALVGAQEEARKALARKALRRANIDNPNGPIVYAARLLGIERSRLTRFMLTHKLDKAGEDVGN